MDGPSEGLDLRDLHLAYTDVEHPKGKASRASQPRLICKRQPGTQITQRLQVSNAYRLKPEYGVQSNDAICVVQEFVKLIAVIGVAAGRGIRDRERYLLPRGEEALTRPSPRTSSRLLAGHWHRISRCSLHKIGLHARSTLHSRRR